MASLSDGAIALARQGWSVFPVDASTKKPRTTHGHLDATSSVGQIIAWARRFDDGGAIATPTGDGLFVLDIDPRNGGRVPSWAPPTRTVKTQSGGTHLHYRIDRDIKSRAGLFGAGIDSKSAGGYVLLPPSPGYSWADTRPRTVLSADWLAGYIVPDVSTNVWGGAERLPPEQWRRGIIHDQVVAWAAYFAAVGLDDEDVEKEVWNVVNSARDFGTVIDNRGDHIGTAIRWVLAREAAKGGPDLS